MKYLKLIAFALGWPAALPLHAGDTPVVIELYTSQGCASCPPADALLMELAEQENVIALAQHVDYWDYIGWKDSFAQPEFSDRQRNYAHVAGRDMIYTPQMIINGEAAVVGARSDEVSALIREMGSQQDVVTVETLRTGRELSIQARFVDQAVNGPLLVQVVQFSPLEVVQVARGENAGRRLKYANVVKNWTLLERWNNKDPYEASLEINPDQSTAVLIQYPGPGKIIGAALIE